MTDIHHLENKLRVLKLTGMLNTLDLRVSQAQMVITSCSPNLTGCCRHEIKLLGTVEGEGKAGCIAGARACPPEDCGGTPGYYELLKAISNPKHKEHYAMLEWLERKYDPEAFDVVAVDRALKRLR